MSTRTHTKKRVYTKNRKRFTRTPREDLQELQITNVIITILVYLVRYRRLRGNHFMQLLIPVVPGATETIKRDTIRQTLRAMYDHGLIDRQREPVREEEVVRGSRSPIYAIAPPGARILRDRQRHPDISDFILKRIRFALKPVKPISMPHTLRCADVIVAIESACLRSSTVDFIAPEVIYDGVPDETKKASKPFLWSVSTAVHDTEMGVEPDHFLFGLRFLNRPAGWNTMVFAPEIDCGTMPIARQTFRQSSLHRKYLTYVISKRTGVYPKRFNVPYVHVLTTTTTPDRIQRIINMLLKGTTKIPHAKLVGEAGYKPYDFYFIETDILIDILINAPDPFGVAWRMGNGEAAFPMQPPAMTNLKKFFEVLGQGVLLDPQLSITDQYELIDDGNACCIRVRATATLGDVALIFERECHGTPETASAKAAKVRRDIVTRASQLPLRITVIPTRAAPQVRIMPKQPSDAPPPAASVVPIRIHHH